MISRVATPGPNGEVCRRLGPRSLAQVVKGRQFRATKMMGYLWPVKLWVDFFSKKWGMPELVAPEDRIEHWQFDDDLAVDGILEDPKAGWAPGVFDLNEDTGIRHC